VYVRPLHDVGDLVSGRPRELHVTYSQHRFACTACLAKRASAARPVLCGDRQGT